MSAPGVWTGSSRLVLLVVAVLAAFLAGAALQLARDDGGPPRAGPTATTRPAVTTTTGTTTGSTTGTTTGTTTGPTARATASPVPAPTGYVASPPGRPGADFVLLRSATLTASGDLRIVVDRAQWLTGDAYDAWVAEHGPPENDYVIVNESDRLRTFTVPAGAPLTGSILLAEGAGSGQAPLTATRLATAMQHWTAASVPVPAWLFHATTDLDSAVVAVQEQYVP